MTEQEAYQIRGCVYLVRELGNDGNPLHKVGATGDLDNRMNMLKPSFPDGKMVFLWAILTNYVGELERYWQKRWADKRAKGCDWFFLSPRDVDDFRTVRVVEYRDIPPIPVVEKTYTGPWFGKRTRKLIPGDMVVSRPYHRAVLSNSRNREK